MSQLSWVCAAVYVKRAELEIAGRKDVSDFGKGALRNCFIGLLEHITTDEDTMTETLLKGMFELNRVTCIKDCHTSAHFGYGTTRLTYVFIKMNVFPTRSVVKERKVALIADGLTSILEDKKIKANVQMEIVFSVLSPEVISGLLLESPEWFCGELPEAATPKGKGGKENKITQK